MLEIGATPSPRHVAAKDRSPPFPVIAADGRVGQPRLRRRFGDGGTGRDRGWRLTTARRRT